jgi:general secretion pathway protein N
LAKEADMTYRALVLIALLAALAVVRDGARATDAPSLANPLAAQMLDGLTATRDRPLFSPSRRPPPPPPPVLASVQTVAVKPIDPPSIILLGIVTEGGQARAVLRTQSSNKAVRARLGDEVGSWTVTRIEPRRLILSHDERAVSYALFAGNPAKNTAGQATPAMPEAPVQTVAQERINRRTGRER